MPNVLELHEFFVEGGAGSKSHVLLHISEPSTPEEKKKGYFFAVAELRHGSVEEIKRIQEMIDGIEAAYGAAGDTDDASAFEKAVEGANRLSHRLFTLPDAEFHCLVGTLRGQALAFASHGSPQVLLFYERDGTLQHLRATPDDPPKTDQLFSSILTGSLSSGEYFFVATPGVESFFPPERLRSLLPGRRTKDAARHIETALSSLENGLSYGGIFFHILPPGDAPKTGPQLKYVDPEPARSAPSAVSAIDVETNERPRPVREKTPAGEGILIVIGRALVAGAMFAFRFFQRLAKKTATVGITIIVLATNAGGQRTIVLGNIRAWLSRKQQTFRDLPLPGKAILLIMVVMAILFFGSMGWISFAKRRNDRLAAYATALQTIRDKKDAAEASVIYGDDTRAFALIQEANKQINALETAKTTDVAPLRADLDALTKKLQKWVVVQSTPIVRLTDTAGDANVTALASLEDTLIAFGPLDPRLYIINPHAPSVRVVPHETIPELAAGNTPKENDTIVFSTTNGLAAYDKAVDAVVARDISFPAPEARIRSLFVYNQRLFTLDPTTNQIYRHAKTQTGYERGSAWIKDSSTVDLHDAVSLAIDGDIFVLTASSVLQFASGVLQPFRIQNLDPALDHPSSLWTYNGVNYLYILEPANKRLIVLEKSGMLVKQYTDLAWKNPTGMVIDEAKKTAYILDSAIVYKMTLE